MMIMSENVVCSQFLLDDSVSLFDLDVPEGAIIRVFKNRPFVTGHLRVDSGVTTLTPWKTAMKWKEYMKLRGWETTSVENRMTFGDNFPTVVVAIMLEKQR